MFCISVAIVYQMARKHLNKQQIIEAAKKLISAKRDVIAYSNNQTSREELNDLY
ncbi:hypothetical protein C900_03664 [Fulvivirga imtechensis AK7]|uniref:Uncharacterized protein n=1 Tax=Fulvivirga imtechensis AK7 TaxID=1237149 RepID=L8JNT7_9BACT|nr:hypothetical protein C900_03664 [Fulvivirga imtechensis AK7]